MSWKQFVHRVLSSVFMANIFDVCLQWCWMSREGPLRPTFVYFHLLKQNEKKKKITTTKRTFCYIVAIFLILRPVVCHRHQRVKKTHTTHAFNPPPAVCINQRNKLQLHLFIKTNIVFQLSLHHLRADKHNVRAQTSTLITHPKPKGSR